MNVTIKSFNRLTCQELYRILQLRSEVFILEQRIVCQDMDDIDLNALHVCLKSDSTVTDGYLRLFEQDGIVHIGRVLVAKALRGRHLGAALMKVAIDTAGKHFPGLPIRLHSQEQAVGFYEKLGFRICSERFMEEGVPHFEMELSCGCQ